MNWKATAVLGALLAVALGAYLLRGPGTGPDAGQGGGPQKNRLFPDILSDRVAKVEILRKGETATVIDRGTDAVGEYWRLAPPVDKPAEYSVVQPMLMGLDRFVSTGGMEPGRPETAPAVTGLDDPRLTVTFTGPQEVKGTIRFGKQPPTNSTAVFFQKAGDPKIYLAGQEVFDVFDKSAVAIRQKQLVRYAPHQVVKIDVAKKFTRVRQGQPTTTEIERSTMERLSEGVERGWWLTSPHREKLEELKVQRLVMDLASLPIEDWRPAGDLQEQGLAEPDEKVSLWLFGSDKPVVVRFGAFSDLKRKRFAHVEGSGEVARVDSARVGKLPLERKHFRLDTVFPFTRESVKSLRVEAPGVGKLEIVRKDSKNAETGVAAYSWEVTQPPGLRVDRDRVDSFVGTVIATRIADFLGDQDFKVAKLDPAELTLRVENLNGRTETLHFTDKFMRREGVQEVFEVEPGEMTKIMKRLELNFMHREIFNIPRDSITGFTFESRADLVYYKTRFDPPSGKWFFEKPDEVKGKEPNPQLVIGILNVMNYVQAEELITRDPAQAAQYKLEERTAPATLTVHHAAGNAVFYISADQSDKPLRPIYYARLEGGPVVFQLTASFVESLRQLQKKQ